MKPAVKEFTKENPCTKLDLWNCFWGGRGFVPVPVPVAHSVIGINAPRVMERNGRLERKALPDADMYVLTRAGEDWLWDGLHRYLKNHPAKAGEAKPILSAPTKSPVRRIRRPA